MDSLKKIADSVCQKTYPEAIVDASTAIMMVSLLVQIIKLIHDCNKSKLSESVLHSPRTLEKAWLIRRLKMLLPDSHKYKYRDIYSSILSSAASMTQKDIDSVILEVLSVDSNPDV